MTVPFSKTDYAAPSGGKWWSIYLPDCCSNQCRAVLSRCPEVSGFDVRVNHPGLAKLQLGWRGSVIPCISNEFSPAAAAAAAASFGHTLGSRTSVFHVLKMCITFMFSCSKDVYHILLQVLTFLDPFCK